MKYEDIQIRAVDELPEGGKPAKGTMGPVATVADQLIEEFSQSSDHIWRIDLPMDEYRTYGQIEGFGGHLIRRIKIRGLTGLIRVQRRYGTIYLVTRPIDAPPEVCNG